MKNFRKVISVTVAVLVLFTMTIPAYASFSDTAKHWAATQINKWVEKGVISGNPDGTYAPDKAISRAEFSSMIGKLFNYVNKSGSTFSDVPANAWYADAVSKAAAAGVIVGEKGKFRPTASITREEAAVIFNRAFALQVNEIATASKYADAKDIDSWAKEAVSAVSEKGYMKGQPGNKFAPLANVTRAEAVKMIDNAVEDLKNKAGSYTGTVNKGLIVNTADVTLKDMVINGDLILAQGIGEGNVTLDNVKVTGRTVVMGGGANSIHLVNTSLTGTLVVIKKDGKVRIVAEGSTNVPSVQLNSGAKLEESKTTGKGFEKVQIIAVAPGQDIVLDGDFENVIVSDSNAAVEVTDGKVGTIEIAKTAAGASVSIAAGAVVSTLTANAAVEVSGTGAITTANINAPAVVIAQKPATVNLAKDVPTATVDGVKVDHNPVPAPAPTTNTNTNTNTNTTPSNPVSAVAFTTVGSTPISASVSGSTYTIDLTNVSDGTFINGLQITSSPVADTLKSSDVSGAVITGTNGAFAFSGNNSLVTAFLGTGVTFDGNISVKTIKSVWSAGAITRGLSVYNGTTKVQDITLVVKVTASGDTLGTQDLLNCYTVSAANGAITATLKPGCGSKSIFSGANFLQMVTNMVTIPTGATLSGIDVNVSGHVYNFTGANPDAIFNNIKTTALGFDNVLLSELVSKNVVVTVHTTSTQLGSRDITVSFK